MRHAKSSIPTKGFTLLELIVVVAIVALCASILIPSINRARELEQVEEAQQNLQRCFITIAEKREHKEQFFVVDDKQKTWLCEGSEETTDLELYNSMVEDKKYYVAFYKVPDQTMPRIVKASKED
jgi:prepilin-type N-terminal cleavage/methylation domain-containing protein